jgi:hypothetical protein
MSAEQVSRPQQPGSVQDRISRNIEESKRTRDARTYALRGEYRDWKYKNDTDLERGYRQLKASGRLEVPNIFRLGAKEVTRILHRNRRLARRLVEGSKT